MLSLPCSNNTRTLECFEGNYPILILCYYDIVPWFYLFCKNSIISETLLYFEISWMFLCIFPHIYHFPYSPFNFVSETSISCFLSSSTFFEVSLVMVFQFFLKSMMSFCPHSWKIVLLSTLSWQFLSVKILQPLLASCLCKIAVTNPTIISYR